MTRKPHMHKYIDEDVANSEVLELLDKVESVVKGWVVKIKNKGFLLRQYRLPTTEPKVEAIMNIWSTGTILITSSPKISSGEFQKIVKRFTLIIDKIKEAVEQGWPTEKALQYII